MYKINLEHYKEILNNAFNFDKKKILLNSWKEENINPFSLDTLFNENLFVNYPNVSDIIDKITFEVGTVRHGVKKHIFITGPTSSGKSFLIFMLNQLFTHLNKDEIKYYFNYKSFDLSKNNFDIEGNIPYLIYNINKGKEKYKKFGVALFSSGNGNQIEYLIKYLKLPQINIFEIKISDWLSYNEDFKKNSGKILQIYRIRNPSFEIIEKIIKKRIDFFAKRYNIDIDNINLILNGEALRFIANTCNNNIGLIFFILYQYFNKYLNNTQSKIKEDVLKQNLDLRKIITINKKFNHLSKIKRLILEILFFNQDRLMSSKLISEKIERNWSSISNHLKDLFNDSFLRRHKTGRNVYYELTIFSKFIIERQYEDKI